MGFSFYLSVIETFFLFSGRIRKKAKFFHFPEDEEEVEEEEEEQVAVLELRFLRR